MALALTAASSTALAAEATRVANGDVVWGASGNTANSNPSGTKAGTATAFGGTATDTTANQYTTAATAENATAFGEGSRASGQNSTAFGQQAAASGKDATAFGQKTTASGARSTAFGEKTAASGQVSTAFGNYTKATDTGATAFGSGSIASGLYATAFDSGEAVGRYSTAFGDNTVAGIAIDENGAVSVKQDDGTTIMADAADLGTYTGRNGTQGTSYKAYTDSSGKTYSVQGSDRKYTVLVTNDGKTVYKKFSGEIYGVTINPDGTTTGSNTPLAGYSEKNMVPVSGTLTPAGNATAFGNKTVASGKNATSFGDNTTASGTNATAFGSQSKATGDNATAFGAGSSASGANSLAALGGTTAAEASSAVALGSGAKAEKADTFALGKGASASADNTLALGNGASATADNAVALGAGSAAGTAKGTVSGEINGKTYAYVGTTPIGTVSVGASGKERTLTNVAAGQVTASSTDAINGSQLYATNQAVGENGAAISNLQKGWNLTTASDGGEVKGSSVSPVKAGDSVTLSAGSNIRMNQEGNKVTVAVSDTPVFTKVTETSVPKDGKAGDTTVTTPGGTTATRTDEEGKTVTSSSLTSEGVSNTKNGTTATLAPAGTAATTETTAEDGKKTSVTVTPGETTGKTDDSSKLTGDKLNLTSKDTKDITTQTVTTVTTPVTEDKPESSTTSKKTEAVNTAVDRTNDQDSRGIVLTEKTTTTTTTTIDDQPSTTTSTTTTKTTSYSPNGMTITNINKDGDKTTVSLTSGGLNNGGNTITNVAPGVNNTDAVNVSQLNAQKTHFYSVKSTDSSAGNYNNDGATGTNALAAGVNAEATGDQSVAMGNGSKAWMVEGIAVGDGASSNGNGGVAVGGKTTRLNDKGKIETVTAGAGANAAALGSGANAYGENSVAAGTLTGAAKNAAALGASANAYGENGVALGSQTGATTNAAAVGALANAYGENGAAFGTQAGAGKNAAAVGSHASASGEESLALGAEASAVVDDGKKGTIAVGFKAQASGGQTAAFGYQAAAAGENTLALGNGASTSGSGTMAIGSQSGAAGTDTISIGTKAGSSDLRTIAIGAALNRQNGAKAAGTDTIALGTNASASGDSTVAIGKNTNAASGINAVAIGTSAGATGGNSLSLGYASKAYGQDSIAMGRETDIAGTDSVGIGRKTNASGSYTMAIGTNASASYTGAVAIGSTENGPDHTNASGNYAYAIGSKALSTGEKSYAVGYNAKASGTDSLAYGSSAVATDAGSIAIGRNTQAYQGSSLALGDQAVAKTQGGVAIGSQAATSNNNAVAVGTSAKADTADSIALGDAAHATGERSIAIGKDSVSDANDNISLGNSSNAKGNYSVALGKGAKSYTENSVAIGSQSIASAEKGAVGYDVTGFSNEADTTGTWKSTLGAVSVGDAANKLTRQITGVAAGTADTDAVNVAQLKRMAAAEKTEVTSDDHTVTVTSKIDGDDGHTTYDLSVAKGALTAGSDGKVTAANATYTTTATDDEGNPVITTHDIANSYATVSNVADAINQSGFGLTTSQSDGTASGTTVETIHPGDKVTIDAGKNIKITQDKAKISVATADDLQVNSVTATTQTVDGAGNTITTTTVTNGNGTTTTKTKKDKDSGKETVLAMNTSSAGGVTVKDENGNTTTLSPTSISVANGDKTKPSTTISNTGLTITNLTDSTKTVSVTDKGLSNGGQKITHVGVGDVNAASTDAVNGSQLNQTNQNVTNNATEISKLQGGFTVTTGQTGSGTVKDTTGDAKNKKVKAGDTVTFQAGDNLHVAQDGRTIAYSLNDKITLGSGVNQVTMDGTAGTVTLGQTLTNPMITLNGKSGLINIGGDGGATLKQGSVIKTVDDGHGGTTTQTDTTYELTGLTNKDRKASDYAKAGRAATEEQLEALRSDLGEAITVSATKMDNGTNTTKGGSGTSNDPYTVNLNPTLTHMQEVQFDKEDNRGALNGGGLYLTSKENIGVDPKTGKDTVIKDPTKEIRFALNGMSMGSQTVDNVKSAIADKDGTSYLDKLKTANDSDKANGDTAGFPKNSAVNVSDLYNTANALEDKGLKFGANSGSDVTNKLGSKVTVKGTGAKEDEQYSGSNIKTKIAQGTDGNTTIDVMLDKDLAVDSVTTKDKAGNTTVTNGSGVTINGKDNLKEDGTVKDTSKTVSITNTGLSNGGNVITNVASGGTTVTNAANIGDVLKNRNTYTAGTNIASITKNTSDDNGTSYTINAKGAAVAAGANTHVSSVTDDKTNVTTYTVSADKAVVTSGTNYGVTVDSKDTTDEATGAKTTTYTVDLAAGTIAKIDHGQMAYDTVNDKGITFQGDTTNTTTKKLGGTMVINGDDNITTDVDTDGSMKVQLSENLKNISSLSNTKSVTDPATGMTTTTGTTIKLSESENKVDAGGAKVTKIDAGEISDSSTDAVNGSQLKNMGDSMATTIGGGTTFTAGKLTVPSTGIANTGKTNVSDAITAARTTVASADGIVTVTKTEKEGAYAYDLSIAKTGIQTGTDGKVTTDPSSKTTNGFVTAGDVTKAINNAGFTLKTSATAEGAKDEASTGDEMIKPGSTVEMVAGKNMKVTQAANGKVTYATKDAVDFNSITSVAKDHAGNTVGTTIVNGSGITIIPAGSTTSRVSLTDKGLDNGNNTITRVKSGLTNADGSTTTLENATGDTLTNAANIGDLQIAVQNVVSNTTTLTNKGLVFAANNNSEGVTNKLGSKVTVKGSGAKESDHYSGDNIKTKVSQDREGNTTIDVMLDKDLNIDNVTAGKAGKDGKDGTIGAYGKDGVSVVLNGKDGSIGLTGTPGADGTPGTVIILKGEKGDPGVNGTDGINRLVVDGHQAATMGDGMKYSGDAGSQLKMKLNTNVNIKGGVTDTAKLSDGNIGVVADGKDTLTVKLAKDLKNLSSVTTRDSTGHTNTMDGSGNTMEDANGNMNITTVNGQLIYDAAIGNMTTLGASGVTITPKGGKETSLTADKGLTVGGNTYITKDGINANGQTISNVKAGTADTDAVNVSQLNKAISDSKTVLKDGKNTTVSGSGTAADPYKVNVADNVTLGGKGADGKDGVDGHMGVNGADGKTGVAIDGKDGIFVKGDKGEIGISSKDGISVKGKDGKDAVSMSGKDGVGHIGLTGQAGTNGKDGSNAVDITVKNGYDGVNGVKGEKGVDGKDGITRIVYTDKTGEHQVATMDDGMKYSGDAGSQLKMKLNTNVNIKGGVTDTAKLSDGNIGVVADGKDTLTVKLAKDLKGLTNVTAQTLTADDGKENNTVVNAGGVTITPKDGKETSLTADKGLTVGGNTYIADKGIDANNQKITNVAAGKDDTDAVNVGQLKETNAAVLNNSNAINKLGNRVDRVGAGAAALAALHPQDFDPDDKWDFAVGYGNYRGANAAAVGAFYRPNEDTTFSVGGTVGGGENMVNAGVSFKFGQGNHVTNSRVAMAKELLALKDYVQKQDEKIEMLEALVGQHGTANASKRRSILFPDVPENHWAYVYVKKLADRGLLEGYLDGEFKGDRTITRYEFAAIFSRALENGASVDGDMERMSEEFEPEIRELSLNRFRVDRVEGKDNDRHKIERVRVNDRDEMVKQKNGEQKKRYRDIYGSVIERDEPAEAAQ